MTSPSRSASQCVEAEPTTAGSPLTPERKLVNGGVKRSQLAASNRERPLKRAPQSQWICGSGHPAPKPEPTIPIAPKAPALSSLSNLSPLDGAHPAATNLGQSTISLWQRCVHPCIGTL